MQNNSTPKQLRTQLRYGDIEKIMAATGHSRGTIQRYFNGENNHEEIRIAAETLINEHQKKAELAKQRIQKSS